VGRREPPHGASGALISTEGLETIDASRGKCEAGTEGIAVVSPSSTQSNGARSFRTVADAMRSYSRRDSRPTKETLLKEYEFLRAEVNATLAAQLQILSFGTATLGLVASAAFVGSSGAVRSDVLVVFLPLLAYLTLNIWFAEVMRMLRAGSFLLTVEKKLDVAGDGSLDWEAGVWWGRTRLSSGGRRSALIRPYYSLFDPDQLRLFSVTLLFFTISGSSIAMGWAGASPAQRWFAVGAGIVAALLVVLLYHLRLDQVAETLDVDERPALTRGLAGLAQFLAGEEIPVRASQPHVQDPDREAEPPPRSPVFPAHKT
jgi:hypothetical protein